MDSLIPSQDDCTCQNVKAKAGILVVVKDPECPYHVLYGWGYKQDVGVKDNIGDSLDIRKPNSIKG